MADYAGSISPLQIYQAIRNRAYTNEVRLRGLKEFETHVGGFCLYSREFHETVGQFLMDLTPHS
ncbi:hypothetical protein [Nostoc sp. PCC 9305]|uniref:hypothetical protein n=1 Tax=Nostoc sp. PCC 9305 TaxID=296636 RepID=UPI0039C6D8A3